MHPRTTAAVLLATAGLALTACGGHGSHDKTAATPPTTTAAATTASSSPTPAYDPAAWKTRVHQLVGQLDPAQAECTVSPSSDACANALRSTDTTLLAMKQDLDNSGQAAEYPATVDLLGKILAGYNSYISDDCPGNPLADDHGSQCRTDMATVLLGTATLTSKMILDAGAQ